MCSLETCSGKQPRQHKQEFEREMNELKEVDEDAYNWLNTHSTTIWARHIFSGDSQSNIVLNIMCESFNNRILKFNGKISSK